MPPIIAFQREVQASMARQTGQLHVVLEHFSFDLQGLLDDFSAGKITFEEVADALKDAKSNRPRSWKQ